MTDPHRIMLTAAAVAWIGGALIGGGLAALRTRSGNIWMKGFLFAAIVVAAVAAPGAQDAVLMKLNKPAANTFAHTFIDPGPVQVWAPMIVTLLAAIVSTTVSNRRSRHLTRGAANRQAQDGADQE